MRLLLVLFGAFGVPAAAQKGGRCVVVTGCTGWVGGWVVQELVTKGYPVHCTVRDSKDTAKLKFLTDMGGNITFFDADLLSAEPFDAAAAGCSGFIHVASPVASATAKSDPDSLVAPAVRGTKSALTAAWKAGVDVFVMTSSSATIAPSLAKMGGCGGAGVQCDMYSELDYNDVATPTYGTYSYSKVKAEEAAIALQEQLLARLKKIQEEERKSGIPIQLSEVQGLPSALAANSLRLSSPSSSSRGNGPRLTSIHFSMAIGPQQNSRVTSSQVLVEFLLLGRAPFVLPLSPQLTDVRDVARAHVHVLEHPEAVGRYLVAVDPKVSGYPYIELADTLRAVLPSYPIPTVTAPFSVLTALAALGVDKKLDVYQADAAVRAGTTGRIDQRGLDGSKITRDLGFVYEHADLALSIKEAALSMVEHGVVDGNRHTLPVITVVMVALAAVAVFFGVRLVRLCFPAASARTKAE